MDIEEAMMKTVSECRGRILQFVIHTEAMIDFYITKQFFAESHDLHHQLKVLLVSELSQQKKNSLFLYFAEKNKDADAAKIKFLNTEFEAIFDERNLFAHYPLLFSTEAKERYRNEKVLTFTKLRKGRFKGKTELSLHYAYSNAAMNSLIRRIVNLNADLQDIVGILNDAEPPIRQNSTG